jgi:hypothetical protein
MTGNLKDFNDVGLLFPSEYLQAADLRGKDVTVTIEKVDPRHSLKKNDGSSDAKPVVTFAKAKKKWVLNKTNAKAIAKLHGKPLEWIGEKITLYPTTCEAFGDVVDCIRVRPQRPKSKQAPPTEPEQTDMLDPTEGKEEPGL